MLMLKGTRSCRTCLSKQRNQRGASQSKNPLSVHDAAVHLLKGQGQLHGKQGVTLLGVAKLHLWHDNALQLHTATALVLQGKESNIVLQHL